MFMDIVYAVDGGGASEGKRRLVHGPDFVSAGLSTIAWPSTEKYGSMPNPRNRIIVKKIVGSSLE